MENRELRMNVGFEGGAAGALVVGSSFEFLVSSWDGGRGEAEMKCGVPPPTHGSHWDLSKGSH